MTEDSQANKVLDSISPVLVAKFHALNEVSWFASAYYLPQAALTVFFGKLANNVNLRFVFAIGTAVFSGMSTHTTARNYTDIIAVGTALCVAAESSTMFVIARTICGLGTAALMPVALAMLAVITTEAERPIYIAMILGVEAISAGLGPMLGAIFAEKLSFRYAFVMCLVLSVLSGVVVYSAFDQQPPIKRHLSLWQTMKREFDLLGSALFTISSMSLLLGLQFAAQSLDWAKPQIITPLAVGGITTIFFFIQQYHGDRTLKFFPSNVVNREVVLSVLGGFFLVGSNKLAGYFLSFYLIEVRDQSVITSSEQVLPYLITAGIGSIALGFALGSVSQHNYLFILGAILLTAGTYPFTQFDEHTSIPLLIGVSIIPGLGAGIVTVLTLATAQRHVHSDDAALTMSLVLTMQLLGSTMGITLAGTLLNQHLSSAIEKLDINAIEKLEAIENLSQWHIVKKTLRPEDAERITRLFADATARPFWLALVTAAMGTMLVMHLGWYKKGTSYQSLR